MIVSGSPARSLALAPAEAPVTHISRVEVPNPGRHDLVFADRRPHPDHSCHRGHLARGDARRFHVTRLTLLYASFTLLTAARADTLPRKGLLGAQITPLPADRAAKLHLKPGRGVAVGQVFPGTTAEAAGLSTGDVLLVIDRRPVASPAEVVARIHALNAGDTVTLEILHDGVETKKSATLVARPKQQPDGFDVVYDECASNGKRVRIIVTKPTEPGRHPALFLIGGIGAYSLDGDFSKVLYGDVLDPIAKAGYVTVRIDKPGQGDSEGPTYADLDFDTELAAYKAALAKAKTYDFVDPDRMFVFGHSMGGAFAPIVASTENVRGVAVCGTIAKTWEEYLLDNNRRQSLLAGSSYADVGALLRKTDAINHYIYFEHRSPAEVEKAHPELAAQVKADMPDGKTFSGVGLNFFRQLDGYNLAAYWAKVDTDVLAIYCANDFLSNETDHPLVAAIVNASHPGKGHYVRLEGIDHGFSQTTSMKDSFDHWGQRLPFNPVIVKTLMDWMNGLARE